jgi:hypothetical protein
MRVAVCRLVTLTIVLSTCGCRQTAGTDAVDDVKVDLTVRPDPPQVGDASMTVRLTGKEAKPVRGAMVKLEGNMNHAGMKPEFADAKETEAGQYEANLRFSMGGDWFILVNATLADGRKLKRKVDVPAVRSR